MMLWPVEFKLSPSCFECLSWSGDGEVAIAGGDHVQILTPNPKPRDTASQSQSRRHQGHGAEQWTTVKLPTNLFTTAEWHAHETLRGNVFSPGEEQSASHVVALAWSPPGLASSYGRCVLGVLTSNLVLSLWVATDGHAQWRRAAVVNRALQEHFRRSCKGEGDETLVQQMQRIRSFCWSPSVPDQTQTRTQTRTRRHRHRHLLVVTNDCADVIFLEARSKPSPRNGGKEKVPWTEVVTTFQLPRLRDPYPQIDCNSLLALSFRRLRIIDHLSWGPWIQICATTEEDTEGESISYVSQVALIDGPELVILRVETLAHEAQRLLDLRISKRSVFSEIEKAIGRVDLKGPLSWIHKDDNDTIGLVVGTLDGCVSITMSREDYTSSEETPSISVRKHDLLPAYRTDDADATDWYPITGIAQSFDAQMATPSLHVTSLSSRTTFLSYPTMESIPPAPATSRSTSSTEDSTYETSWRKQIESFRNQFDLDYDLRGMSRAKIWGIAGFRGWIAACFSLHPADMFEHTMASKLRSRVVFARPPYSDEDGAGGGGAAAKEVDMPWYAPTLGAEELQQARERVLEFTLDPHHREGSSSSSSLREGQSFRRLLYAAACCVLVLLEVRRRPDLLAAARSAMQWLSKETGLDLGQEVSAIDALETMTTEATAVEETAVEAPTTTILPAKPPDVLSSAGATDLFEACEVCGAGIEWYSAAESQCAQGHLFVRCGVTFLSIQGPLNTKRCSRCGTEVLRREAGIADGQVDDTSTMLDVLLDEFDTCVYCGGKYRG